VISDRTYLRGAVISAIAVAAISVLAAGHAPPTVFDEITVGRINVREPDGTLRMVISNRAQFPDTPWKGADIPRPDRRSFAGMLFVNDEGTENGGLIQKGFVGPGGKADAGLSLTFDRFRQDQVIQLMLERGQRVSNRVLLGTTGDGASALSLADAKGRPRLMLIVTADGKPSVQFLDEGGQVTRSIQLEGGSGSSADSPTRPQ
jgi:hypothetical protein